MGEQRREYYRVEYPRKYRPNLTLGGKAYKVINISESGVRFGGAEPKTFRVGQAVDFNIRFRDGDTVDLWGKVVRVDRATVAIRLDCLIPLDRIRSEDRYLIKNFPLYTPMPSDRPSGGF